MRPNVLVTAHEEPLGARHHLVRHPDMSEAAFAEATSADPWPSFEVARRLTGLLPLG